MPQLTFIPAGVISQFCTASGASNDGLQSEAIAWTTRLDDEYSCELETGGKLDELSGKMRLEPASDANRIKNDARGLMVYHPAQQHVPETYALRLQFLPAQYAEIASKIAGGAFPVVHVSFHDALPSEFLSGDRATDRPVTYGDGPDHTDVRWANTGAGRVVAVENFSIELQWGQPESEAENGASQEVQALRKSLARNNLAAWTVAGLLAVLAVARSLLRS
jgi:hypothetical protein